MKTMNVTPMTVAQYESVATTKFNKKAFTAKCKKAKKGGGSDDFGVSASIGREM